jgi:rod shape determining protein RodA
MQGRIAGVASRIDWILLMLVGLIAAVGVLNLYSSSQALGEEFHLAQGVWLSLGVALGAGAAVIDYRNYERWAWLIYGFVIFLLVVVLLVGTTLNGSKRWLDFGFFLLQPSELMKIAVIILVARVVADVPKVEGYSPTDLAFPLLLLAIPTAFIMLQPDLGTSIVVGFIFFTMVFFHGVQPLTVVVLGGATAVMTPILWFFVMEDYQKRRVLSFLDLEKDPFGPGWQVRQALIAFGSGGFFGKGYLNGTQVQMGFVPYHESDFAAVNWAEEHGFAGMVLILALYCGLIGWALRIARQARDRFGMMISVGVASLIFWHVIINLGMVLGLLPVVGLTLPLVSYGGSSVITIMLALGLLMNVSMRRHSY